MNEIAEEFLVIKEFLKNLRGVENSTENKI